MTALDVIRRVELLGGRLVLDHGELRLRADGPLPDEVVAAVGEQKASIMVALGALPDTVVGSVLKDVRPHLPASLRSLPDDKLLVLVGWTIFSSWEKAIQKFTEQHQTARGSRGT